MKHKFKILGINGSASKQSSNLAVLELLKTLGKNLFELEIIDDLSILPHFATEITNENAPSEVLTFQNRIQNADGVIISTPEYVFSIPSRLKNALEWCVSTTVFSNKPMSLITASANGEMGQIELQQIMQTLQANFTSETTLLIQGINGAFNQDGELTNLEIIQNLQTCIDAFAELVKATKLGTEN